MLKNLKISVMVISAVMLSSTTVFAADGAELYKSKGCGGCHGADAKTPIMPLYPKIAGQSKEYTTQQMKDIKSGARSNGQSVAMKGVMAAVTDDDIGVLSEYLATLKSN